MDMPSDRTGVAENNAAEAACNPYLQRLHENIKDLVENKTETKEYELEIK